MLCVTAEMSYITRITPWFIAYYDFMRRYYLYGLLLVGVGAGGDGLAYR
jgi:hypothetical protein